MPLARPVILVTRPIEDTAETVRVLEQKNYKVISEPLLEVVLHTQEIDGLDQYRGVIFTSKNAVRSFSKNSDNRTLPVWAVGDATRDLALSVGFKHVKSAAGNTLDLQNKLLLEAPNKPLLYIRGRHSSSEFKGCNVTEKILYHTQMKEVACRGVDGILKNNKLYAILFYSTRTAEAFVKLVHDGDCQPKLKHTKALCLGGGMVESLSVLPWQAIEVARQPNQESLMALLD